MHINTIHAALRRANLRPQKRASTGLVRGYHPVTQEGYTVHERKKDNPDWSGFGLKKYLPKYLPTGVYEIRPGPHGTEVVKLALFNAAITFAQYGDLVIVDSEEQSV